MDETLESHDDESWYVVHCKSNKEAYVASILRDYLDLHTYLPEVRAFRRGQAEMKPLFPNYVFFRADLRRVTLSSINMAHGVIRVVEFNGAPAVVPAVIVWSIQDWVTVAQAAGGLPTHNFKPGEVVCLKNDWYKGLRAVFIGPTTPSARVKVRLEFMDRLVELMVRVENLERVAQESISKIRRRGTRGGRRTINYGD